jgi:hypothetical protein
MEGGNMNWDHKVIIEGDLKEAERQLESLSNYKTENLDVATLIEIHCYELEKRIKWLKNELGEL